MFQKIKEKIIENKNWILGVLFLIVILALVIFIINMTGNNFSIRKENKEYKKKIEELNKQFNSLQSEKNKAIEDAEYYKHLSDSLLLVQNNIHNQTTKIIYETNKKINSVTSLSNNDLISEFTKLAEEYWNGYLADKDTSKIPNGWNNGIP